MKNILAKIKCLLRGKHTMVPVCVEKRVYKTIGGRYDNSIQIEIRQCKCGKREIWVIKDENKGSLFKPQLFKDWKNERKRK